DPIVDAAERGQKEHRHLAADRPQRAHERESIEAGQHAVDNEDVISLTHRLREAVTSVGQGLYEVPFLEEPLGDVSGRFSIVLDDENAHGDSFSCTQNIRFWYCEEFSVSLPNRKMREPCGCAAPSHRILLL